MIDRTARTQLGELLRHFVAGRLNNFDFEERVEIIEWNDAAVGAVALESWGLYDDFQKHTLAGKWRIDKAGRRIIARWILFLQTDLEYEWPYPTIKHDWRRIITILTFGLSPKFREPAYPELGDHDVWPFFRVEDYEKAQRTPKLLAGTP